MKLRRLTLMGIVVLASTFVASSYSHGATSAPAGLPLYQFVETGTQPLPWNAVSLKSTLNNTTMLGGPRGASDATEGVLAYRTNKGHLALFTQSATGEQQWIDVTLHNNVPTPAADPVPFFDPSGNVDVLYVDVVGHVIVLSPNDPATPLWSRLHHDTAWRPYVTTDLTALDGVVASNGIPSIQVFNNSATVAYRSAANTMEILLLQWSPHQPVPIYGQMAFNEKNSTVATTTTSTTTTAPTTTTTTKPPATTTTTIPNGPTAFASDPVVLPGATPAFATTLNNGHLVVYTNTGASMSSWTRQNVTSVTGTPVVSGSLALGTSSSTIDLAALTSAGDIELFSTQYVDPPASTSNHLVLTTPSVWTTENITSLAPGAPPLSGALSVQVTINQVTVAGQAANWGDLFVLTNATGSTSWSSTDVSVTAGRSARTVANSVTGLVINGQLTLYAAGVSSPPPQGVGVYAIPSAKWSKAISDGWPIISETGGLGTQSTPWVGFTSTSSVASSPDFLLGQSIYNAHKRVTWLSFWTVSGPTTAQGLTTTNYYNHGFAAGVWVATQIDSYRGLGVGLKPDWVIFDPEGYPDNHSSLDAPGGSSNATIARYAGYWSAMVKGWQMGVNSVDPSLNAGVYASQSEYRNYQLSTLSMPVFMAIAFSSGGPVPVSGASGSNVRGFISFGAVCSPASTLASEASALLNPPWAGQFNTLQFNSGVYCAPPST